MTTVSTESVLLYQDLIDHLRYNVQGGDIDPEQRDYRVAATNALREVAHNFDWQYYFTQARLTFNAAYSTGTLASSGTTVTLTGGTWPSWAKYGRLQVGSVVYTVASRTDNSVIVLDSAPITAFSGSSYALFQNVYTLPSDFRGMNKPLNEQGSIMEGYFTPQCWLGNERQSNNAGAHPLHWTIIQDPDYSGLFALAVEPYPTDAITVDFLYQRSPRRLRLTGFESTSSAGTVAGTAAGTTITGTSTSFDASMVGSFIRLGTTSNYPDGDGGLYPYTEQYRIVSYTSATSIDVFPAITTTVSGVKYRISDPVDAWKGMHSAIFRRAEVELAIARGREQRLAMELYMGALQQARESDHLVHELQTAGNYNEPRFKWAYPTEAI